MLSSWRLGTGAREGERPREPKQSGEGEGVRAREDARPPGSGFDANSDVGGYTHSGKSARDEISRSGDRPI